MITLINTNRMSPPIAPIGLEYVASAVQKAGIPVDILDLCWAEPPLGVLQEYLSQHQPQLIGLSFRNVDDCFWPSAQWFVPELTGWIQTLQSLCSAPVVLGGIGYSIFPQAVLKATGADYGIHGDGETSLVSLYRALQNHTAVDQIPGLVWRSGNQLHRNPPAWPEIIDIQPRRDLVDNPRYFALGGQIGLETKRGCPRQCLYCADPLAKGKSVRLRDPCDIADEAEALLAQGIDVLHLCDAEFNLPKDHALAVCQTFRHRRLGNRLRWYAYLSVVPFDTELADAMRKAGCVGIDFTTDSAHNSMLKIYGQPYDRTHIAHAIKVCRNHGITVMTDMLLGGPGETPDTIAETINFMKQVNPDGVGAGLGMRIYPGTGMESYVRTQEGWNNNCHIKRKYSGPIDLCQPTFYIPQSLGNHPARLVNELIGDDPRFFGPSESLEAGHGESQDHNYNDNTELCDAIRQGARGAYWHLMLKQRGLG